MYSILETPANINVAIPSIDKPIKDYEIEPVTFATLDKKNQRIKFALQKIETNAIEAALFRKNGTISVPAIVKPATLVEKPEFCKDNSKS